MQELKTLIRVRQEEVEELKASIRVRQEKVQELKALIRVRRQGRVLDSSSSMGSCRRTTLMVGKTLAAAGTRGLASKHGCRTINPGGREESSAAVVGVGSCSRTTLALWKTLAAAMAWEAAGQRPWRLGRVLGSRLQRVEQVEDLGRVLGRRKRRQDLGTRWQVEQQVDLGMAPRKQAGAGAGRTLVAGMRP